MKIQRCHCTAGVIAISALGIVMGCGSGGLEFNGDGTVQRVLPRTTPITHFPLPVESFDDIDRIWQLDSDVLDNGRDTATPPGDPYPDWSEPMTDAMADYLQPELFEVRDDTDVWCTQGTEDRDPPPPAVDELQYLGTVAIRAAAMSYVAQWLLQTVDGQVRTDGDDGVLLFDTLSYKSIAISQHAEVDPTTGDSIIPENASDSSLPNPVDDRIALFDHMQDGDVVETENENSLYAPVTMPGTYNDIEWAAGYYNPAPSILFGKYMEIAFENYFIESNYGTLTDAPTSGYFSPSGRLSAPGGVYVDRLEQGFEISYPNALQAKITGTYATGYYAGAIQAHIIGVGVGCPQVAFVRPGITNGEEDVMNVNVETDQIYFVYGNRRMQYTSDALLIMQNVQNYPHVPEDDGSFPRVDALLVALDVENTDGQLNGDCIFMAETTPGPNRYTP